MIVLSGFRWCQFVLFVYFILYFSWLSGKLFTGLIGFPAYSSMGFSLFKGGYAHSNMHMFYFLLIDLDLWNAFCEVSPWGSFLFSFQRQKKVCTPGDEAIMKIHKKLFSGIPFNFTLFVISPKLQSIWSWNFRYAIGNIWAFHLISKNILPPVEPWGMRMWSA